MAGRLAGVTAGLESSADLAASVFGERLVFAVPVFVAEGPAGVETALQFLPADASAMAFLDVAWLAVEPFLSADAGSFDEVGAFGA